MGREREARRKGEKAGDFPERQRYTVSRLCVGDICWTCECRILDIGGEEGMTLAWCECEFPEDHHEMQIL